MTDDGKRTPFTKEALNETISHVFKIEDKEIPIPADIEKEGLKIETVEQMITYWIVAFTPKSRQEFENPNLEANRYHYPNPGKENTQTDFTYDMTMKLIDQTQVKEGEILEPQHQKTITLGKITNIKTLPQTGVITDGSLEDGQRDNYNPQNYNRLQVTALGAGERVRVLAYKTTQEGSDSKNWLFVLGEGGVFGWIEREEYLNYQLNPEFDTPKREDFKEAFIDVPHVKIIEEKGKKTIKEVPSLNTPRGMSFGTKILINQTDDKYYAQIPNLANGEIEEIEIDKSLIQVGIKDLKLEDFTADLEKLIDNVYAWGGQEVAYLIDGILQTLYGNWDCSKLVRDAFRKYGINLPNSSSTQARMADKIGRAHAFKDPIPENGTLRHIEEKLRREYKQASQNKESIVLLVSRGHITIVINPRSLEENSKEHIQMIHSIFRPNREGSPAEIDKITHTTLNLNYDLRKIKKYRLNDKTVIKRYVRQKPGLWRKATAMIVIPT